MPTMTASRHSHCILCGSPRLQPLPRYAATCLVRCGVCSLVFVERIPTSDELIAHYETYGRNACLSPITVQRYHELLDGFELYRRKGRLLDVGCDVGYFLDLAKGRGWTPAPSAANPTMRGCAGTLRNRWGV